MTEKEARYKVQSDLTIAEAEKRFWDGFTEMINSETSSVRKSQFFKINRCVEVAKLNKEEATVMELLEWLGENKEKKLGGTFTLRAILGTMDLLIGIVAEYELEKKLG